MFLITNIPSLLLITTALLVITHPVFSKSNSEDEHSTNSVEPVKIDPILRRALLRALSNLEKTDEDDEDDRTDSTETTDDDRTTTEREFEVYRTEEPKPLTTEPNFEQPATTEVQFHSFIVDAGKSDNESDLDDSSQTITASSVIPLKQNSLNDFDKKQEHSLVAQRNLISAIRANQVIDADESSKATTLKIGSIRKYSTTPRTTTAAPTTTTTTTKRPEHNADGENIEQVEKDGVQVYQAPLVAAFTVHQDAQGLPRSVVPIYKQQQQFVAQQQLLQQGLITSPTQNLAEKQRRLEQQLYEVQQRHREQELYLKQHRYYQERQLQQQRFLLLQQEEERRRQQQFYDQQQQFNQQQQQQQQNQARFAGNFGRQQTQVTFTPSLSLTPTIPREQQLPLREPSDFLRGSQQFARNNQQDFAKSNFLAQDSQNFARNNNQDFGKSNFLAQDTQSFVRNNQNLRQSQRSLEAEFGNVLSRQQLPPQREFREFRTQVQIVPSVTPVVGQNVPSREHLQSNRVFRSELGTGNFGFNDNFGGSRDHIQSNRVFRSELGTGNFGFNDQRAVFNRFSQQDRYRDLLYRSGFTQRPEDLNIVSKVLALNPGGEGGNFLFGDQTKNIPTIVEAPPALKKT